MIKVVGVRFRTAGKIYFFDPLHYEIKRGDHVIVETARGIEFGTAVSGIREVEEESVIQPLKPILRIANQRDEEQERENKEKEKAAFRVCQEKIRKHGLEMKLIDAEYTFDNNKVLFYFTADGRIDFRELVKDLAGIFKTRIELRQIGVRDETKILGGIGICGRPLCCHSYLSDFIAVSIKMAKEQNLSLNPAKISGVCGRLMCCLKNEEETYEELNKKLPGVGDTVVTPEGQKGEVHSVDVLRQRVKVLIEAGDDKELKEYEVESLKFHKHHGKKGQQNLSAEELKELEKLEKEEEEEIEAAAAEKDELEGRREGGDRRGKNYQNRDKGSRDKERPRYEKDSGNRGERQSGERGDRLSRERSEHQSGERGDRQFRERGDRADRQSGERSDRQNGERSDRQNRERSDRQNRERGDRQNQDRNDRQGADRTDRQSGERSNRQGGERSERQNQERNDRQNRERGDRQNQDRRDRSEKGSRQDRGDRSQNSFRKREGGQNRSFRDRNRNQNRDRQGQSEAGQSGSAGDKKSSGENE